jgi:hypothetical protein
MTTVPREQLMEKVVALTKRREFGMSSPFMGRWRAAPEGAPTK